MPEDNGQRFYKKDCVLGVSLVCNCVECLVLSACSSPPPPLAKHCVHCDELCPTRLHTDRSPITTVSLSHSQPTQRTYHHSAPHWTTLAQWHILLQCHSDIAWMNCCGFELDANVWNFVADWDCVQPRLQPETHDQCFSQGMSRQQPGWSSPGGQ